MTAVSKYLLTHQWNSVDEFLYIVPLGEIIGKRRAAFGLILSYGVD